MDEYKEEKEQIWEEVVRRLEKYSDYIDSRILFANKFTLNSSNLGNLFSSNFRILYNRFFNENKISGTAFYNRIDENIFFSFSFNFRVHYSLALRFDETFEEEVKDFGEMIRDANENQLRYLLEATIYPAKRYRNVSCYIKINKEGKYDDRKSIEILAKFYNKKEIPLIQIYAVAPPKDNPSLLTENSGIKDNALNILDISPNQGISVMYWDNRGEGIIEDIDGEEDLQNFRNRDLYLKY